MRMEEMISGGQQGVRCMATGREGGRDLLITGSVEGTISVRDMHNGLLIRSIRAHTETTLDVQVIATFSEMLVLE